MTCDQNNSGERRGLFNIIPRWCVAAVLCLLSYWTIPSFAECLRDNGDGTLTDPNTGLIWQACAVGQVWNGDSCIGEAKTLEWLDALVAADSDRFLGQADWILPTKEQWMAVLGANCKRWDGWAWTSSPYSSVDAWYVGFTRLTHGPYGSIGVDYNPRFTGYAVRLVRASQSSDIGIFKVSLELAEEHRIAPLAYEQAKRANTVATYTEFLKKHPHSTQASEARGQIRNLLEPPIRKAEAAFKCEEARQLDQHFEAAGMSRIFDFDACVTNRKFHNVLNGNNPQNMYLAGVKYENDSDRSRAKKVYLTIMDRFSKHAMAVKAADRLAGMKDVEAVEDSNYHTRRAVEQSEAETRQSVEQASRDADNRQRRSKSEFCSGKSSCFGGCSGLSGDASNRCWSSCNSRFAGC